MKLQRLNQTARRLVTPEFVRDDVFLEEAAWTPYVESVIVDLELDELRRVVDRVVRTAERYDTAIDGAAAESLHRALPMSRRLASDEGVWRYLAVVVAPDFVRHRWENPTFSVARSRFWNLGTRPDSNALARLWWIAELTCLGDDYTLTRRVLANQSIVNSIFIRSYCEHRACVEACVDAFERMSPKDIEVAAKELHHALSTRVLALLGRDDVARLLSA